MIQSTNFLSTTEIPLESMRNANACKNEKVEAGTLLYEKEMQMAYDQQHEIEYYLSILLS